MSRNDNRDTVAIPWHGDYIWERMYTLAHAAAEIHAAQRPTAHPFGC